MADDLRRDLFYRGLRAFPRISSYVCVSALMLRYVLFAGFTLAEKTSMMLRGAIPGWARMAAMRCEMTCVLPDPAQAMICSGSLRHVIASA